MSASPKIHLVAYQDRTPDFIFVAIPTQHGRYLRTDKSVAFVGCPNCLAAIGEPCRSGSGDGYSGTTHVARRNAARRFWGHRANDVLDQASNVPDAWMEAVA